MVKERDDYYQVGRRPEMIPEEGATFFDRWWAFNDSVTALRKNRGEEMVYTRHQELKQASKQAPQAKH